MLPYLQYPRSLFVFYFQIGKNQCRLTLNEVEPLPAIFERKLYLIADFCFVFCKTDELYHRILESTIIYRDL